ncbi:MULTISPECIES: hypothetical protein [Mycolicibacterium]|uniref:hypothetical protein n=1 Tax=Mycolicibacterium TaxID=1866885 RepID=UPI0011AE1B1C|nr:MULTISPECIES: hypothetical protein [Mycolicibacterium]UJL26834.1 hypothetical protein HZU38_17915 [Mycolicibacterium vanbaalenii]WND58955.1 hypothetical protein QQA43_11520 [Mycolicibacterium vanbaalenii]
MPTWRAKELIEDGLAKLAVVRIVYPETWPHLAEVVYPEGHAVVIERPVGPVEKPPVHPHLPDERNRGGAE